MIINERVNHKTYGAGIVTNTEIIDADELNARVLVKFDSLDTTKKFALEAFKSNGFFTSENPETAEYVDSLIETKKEKERIFWESASKPVIVTKYSRVDDLDEKVSKERWEKAFEVAENYRFPYESRAVVMDDDIIYINASAGCIAAEVDPKTCNHVYDRCDGKKKGKYAGSNWRYATKEEIRNIINDLEEGNDTK